MQPDSPFYNLSLSHSAPDVRHSLWLRSSRVLHCSDVLLLARLPVKRKASEEPDSPHRDDAPSSSKDFEAGRVTCEACGESVSYRDERTGSFTTKHWDAHKLKWFAHSSPHPTCARSSLLFFSPAPSSTPPATEPIESHSHPSVSGPSASVETNSTRPPSKRRRAKRSEEERIQYLRSDPYVAQFEAYRVLCASCDKWIRLRPNSTYCSIPWDAHRKSCLARKGCVTPHPFVIILTQRPVVRSRLTTAPKMQHHHLL